MWFVKSRRAQSEFDYETWITNGVVPTLNDFDNKTESRATALILFEATRVDDVRIHEKVSGAVPTYCPKTPPEFEAHEELRPNERIKGRQPPHMVNSPSSRIVYSVQFINFDVVRKS